MASPILYRWSGEAMEPLPRFAKTCNERFVVGEIYRQTTLEERSIASHNHYFAVLHETWLNLPEDKATRWPSEEHLRKWLLIQAGYSNQQTIVCQSKAEARRLPAIVAGLDGYAVTTIRDKVVTIFTAQSQSMRAMGDKEFQASKQHVLDLAAALLEVPTRSLSESRAA